MITFSSVMKLLIRPINRAPSACNALASGEALALLRLGTILTARGRLDDALTLFEEGVIVAERATMRAHCLTRLYASMTRNRLEAADVEAADHYLTLGLAMSERHGHCVTCHALLYPAAVSVRIAQDRHESADEFCRRLEGAAREYQSRAWIAMARQSRAELAKAQDDLTLALTSYEEAGQAFKAIGNEYEAARCLTEMSGIRRRRRLPGDVERAGDEAAEAGSILERLQAS
jgi:tetratricopeptide (TPR) repeat protein